MYSNNLLLKSQVLLVKKPLIKAIGFSQALILQQIDYLQSVSKNVRDGEKWVYNTFAQWVEVFGFLSLSSIKRIIKELEDQKLLISTIKYNKDKRDRTKWYRINRAQITKLYADLQSHGKLSDEMSKSDDAYKVLLGAEQFLYVLPELVKALDSIPCAIVLQQLHYHLQRTKVVVDDELWVNKSIDDWAHECCVSSSTIRRVFNELSMRDLIISKNHAKSFQNSDHTKLYRINYAALVKLTEQLERKAQAARSAVTQGAVARTSSFSTNDEQISATPPCQNETMRCVQNETMYMKHKNNTKTPLIFPPRGEPMGESTFSCENDGISCTDEKKSKDNSYSASFAEFFKAYTTSPQGVRTRKNGKAKALKEWHKITDVAVKRQIIAAVYAYWEHDVDWHNGFQVSPARFIREQHYLLEPYQGNDRQSQALGKAGGSCFQTSYQEFSKELDKVWGGEDFLNVSDTSDKGEDL